MTETFDRLKAILIEKYSLAPERITPEATFESLGLDSLDLIEMLFDVEEAFSIRVPQESGGSGGVRTAKVQDIVDSIDRLVAERDAAAGADAASQTS